MINKLPRMLLAVLTVTAASACKTDREPITFAGDITTMASIVKFEYGAYNLAMNSIYDTVTLKAHAYNSEGEELDADIRYEVDNTVSMSVDSNGVLKAKSAVSGAIIRAFVTINEVTRQDSAYVNVAATAPAELVQDVRLAVPVGDSAKFGFTLVLPRGKNILLVRQGTVSPNLPNIRVAISTSNTAIATVTHASPTGSNVNVRPFKPGVATLQVNSYAYGRGFRDTLEYRIGRPITGYIGIYERIFANGTTVLDFHPGRLVIGVGGCVNWSAPSATALSADVVFEDSLNVSTPQGNSHCHSLNQFDLNPGNILPWKVSPGNGGTNTGASEAIRSRVFNKPGSFKYRSKISGTVGEIYVCDENNDTTCMASNR